MADAVASDGSEVPPAGAVAGVAAIPAVVPRRGIGRAMFRFAFDVSLLPMIVFVAVGRFGNYDWLFDLTNFFKPHIAALALALVAIAALAGSRLRLVAAVGLLAAALYPLLVSGLPVAPAAAAGNFRVMTANVNGENHDFDGLVRRVAELRPDILIAEEATPEWRPALSQLEGLPFTSGNDWPTHVFVASRYPIKVSAVALDPLAEPANYTGGSPPLRVEIERPAGVRPLVLYAVHAPTTRNSIGWTVREAYIRAVKAAAAADAAHADVIVAGDWNTPFWSPRLRIFLGNDGTFRTTERGAWPAPTRFFREVGLPPALGTPIDRVVVSRGIGAGPAMVGADFGSDHLPVTVDLAIP